MILQRNNILSRVLFFLFHIGVQGFVQRQMLQRGFGKAFPFDDTPTFSNTFIEDAEQARAAGLGGWSACGWE